MPPFKDRLSDEAITGVIASFKSLWFDEHRPGTAAMWFL